MEYTNEFGLPPLVEKWLTVDEYKKKKDGYSVTELIKPLKAIILMRRYADVLRVDITSRTASRIGTVIHESFAQLVMPGIIHGEELETELDGIKFYGTPDIIEEMHGVSHKVSDIKTTSVYTWINSSRLDDYIWQLSMYAWLLDQNNTEYNLEKDGEIIYVFMDWHMSQTERSGSYPKTQILIETVPLRDLPTTEEFIRTQLSRLKELESVPDDGLPECTDEELWRDEKYAVMKTGRQRAVNGGVYDNYEDAKAHADRAGQDHSVQHRPGKAVRCKYCDSSSVCVQYATLVAADDIR